MVTGTLCSSLSWSKCSENSPSTLLGCLYFYDFPTKCVAFFILPGFWGHRLGCYVQKCSWQQATEDVGAESVERSITYSSCWDFDLMNLFHFHKLLRLLFLLNLFLCLCSKTGQRICSRNWPCPCFEDERCWVSRYKSDFSCLMFLGFQSLLRAVPLTWQRKSSFAKLFLAQHSCSWVRFSKCHHFCRLSPNTLREIMTTQLCDFDEWTKNDHLSRVSQKSPIGYLIILSPLSWPNAGS